MSSNSLSRALQAVLPALPVALAFHANAISYPDFSDVSAFKLNGQAALEGNGVTDDLGRKVLRLTDDLWQGGSAFLSAPVTLTPDASFSTSFKFRISHPGGISDSDGQGADGLVFVVQTVANSVGGLGGGIGYDGILKSVGVEFDTWDNGLPSDPDGNHVGVDLNGSLNSVARRSIATRLNNGDDWYAWVDYDGANDLLEVRVSPTSTRPAAADIGYSVDLPGVLTQQDAYVGFTSGTGAGSGYHDIVSWNFEARYAPIGVVPEASTFVIGAPLVGAAAWLLRRRATRA